MNRFHALTLSVALAAIAPAASADTSVFGTDALYSQSINKFPIRVLPVLVQVDSQGKVTDLSPAYQLSPQFNRLLSRNLDQMITRPASDKHGRAIPSQFVMNLALRSTPRTDGNFDAQFAYVSTQPVPSGQWYWRHVDGHRLELVNRDDFRRNEFNRFYSSPTYRGPAYAPGYRSFSAPATQQHAAPSMPSVAPAPGSTQKR